MTTKITMTTMEGIHYEQTKTFERNFPSNGWVCNTKNKLLRFQKVQYTKEGGSFTKIEKIGFPELHHHSRGYKDMDQFVEVSDEIINGEIGVGIYITKTKIGHSIKYYLYYTDRFPETKYGMDHGSFKKQTPKANHSKYLVDYQSSLMLEYRPT